THPLVKGTLILVSLAFIIWYFVLLPRIKAKRGDFRDDKGEKLTPSPKAEIDTKTINSTGEIFSQIFILYRDHLKNLILVSLIASIVYTFIIYFLGNGIDDEAFTTNTWFFIITLFDYKSPFGLLL